jgi:hypothetical protein
MSTTLQRSSEMEMLRDIGLFMRQMPERAASIIDEQRSFEATMSTEVVAQVADMKNWRIIDEVMIARGGQFPTYLPLLDNHFRSGSESVIGSSRGFKLDQNNEWFGRVFVAEPANERDRVNVIWSRVKGGHLRAVSLGYLPAEGGFVDIPPGQERTIDGKSYRAKARVLRITQSWQPHEVSLTPIGADSKAIIRSLMGDIAQNPRRIYR